MKNMNLIKGHTKKTKKTINVETLMSEICQNPLFPLITYLKKDKTICLVFQDEFASKFGGHNT